MSLKTNLALVIMLFGNSGVALSYASSPTSFALSTAELSAMSTALNRFKLDGNSIEGYGVIIRTRSDGIEISFVPELVKSSNMVGFDVPSKSEVHYYLDVGGKTVVKVLPGQ